MKGLVKEHPCITHGHRQQWGDGQREGGQGLGGGRQKVEEMGTSIIV